MNGADTVLWVMSAIMVCWSVALGFACRAGRLALMRQGVAVGAVAVPVVHDP